MNGPFARVGAARGRLDPASPEADRSAFAPPRSTLAAMASSRRRRDQTITRFEMLCVLVVLLSIAGLIAWIITHAGGGHFLL